MDAIVRMFVAGALTPDWETPDRFAQLAEDVRQGEVPHLKAGHLLPGDAVKIEGWTLMVETVGRGRGLVALGFGFDHDLHIHQDDLVEVVRLAAQPPCSTRDAARGLWL